MSEIKNRHHFKNVVYQGDNLPILKELESNKIDLCYIDPPFCSQSVRTSKAWGKKIVSFNDEWGGGVQSYIHWLSPRLKEMHRLLSPTGVFCIHLDYRSVHYAKVELDKIFGEKNLVNEVIWNMHSSTTQGRKDTVKSFTKSHNTILIYKKLKNKGVYKNQYTKIDYSNRVKKSFKDGSYHRGGSQNGKKLKKYVNVDIDKGLIARTVWNDIKPLRHNKRCKHNPNVLESNGYPTQKPIELLDRLISGFTDKNDIVFDAFCGGGTTISSAQNLGRRWLGCDISKDAIKVIRQRMAKEHGLKIKVIPTGSLSKDNILRLDPFEFERYVVSLIGQPNLKQRGDGGVDGYTYNHIPIQVKKSYNIGRPVLDSFYKHIEKRGAGIIIAHSFCPTLIEEKNRIENQKGWQNRPYRNQRPLKRCGLKLVLVYSGVFYFRLKNERDYMKRYFFLIVL